MCSIKPATGHIATYLMATGHIATYLMATGHIATYLMATGHIATYLIASISSSESVAHLCIVDKVSIVTCVYTVLCTASNTYTTDEQSVIIL